MDSTGQINWEYILDNNTLFDESSPTMDYQGNIYYTYLVDSGNVKYSRIESVDYFGSYRWTHQFEQPDEWIVMPLVCDKDGTIYCGSTNGYNYYAISKVGELLWQISLDGYYVENSTAIGSDGTLYFGKCKSSTFTQGVNTLIAIQDTGNVAVNETFIKIKDYYLSQNFPNPFNPATTISYQIKESGLVQLNVYDILGKEVSVLVNEERSQGKYSVKFNGSSFSSGVYFYSLHVNDFFENKKMILLR